MTKKQPVDRHHLEKALNHYRNPPALVNFYIDGDYISVDPYSPGMAAVDALMDDGIDVSGSLAYKETLARQVFKIASKDSDEALRTVRRQRMAVTLMGALACSVDQQR